MKGKLAIGAGIAAAAGLYATAEYFFRFALSREMPGNLMDKLKLDMPMEEMKTCAQTGMEWLETQKPEKIQIRSHDGLLLSGTYLTAEQPSDHLVIFIHGYRSGGLQGFSPLGPFYQKMGYNILVVDDRAHGESEGDYIGFGCLDRYDCLEWVRYAVGRMGHGCEITLHGVSMGGATVLMACGLGLPEQVKAIVADCGFTSAWDVFSYLLKRNYRLPAFPILPLVSALCAKRAGYRFNECSTIDAVRNTHIPILFIHGEKDDFVPTYMSHENFEACAAPKRLVIFENAGHGASFYLNQQRYESEVESFLEQI